MGDFIGGVGAAFIMAAAAAVIVKFLMEINIIRDREGALQYGRISLAAIIIGIAYVTLAVYMCNEIKARVNFFAFGDVFGFLGIKDMASLCSSPDMAGMFTGLRMPLYPCLVHIIGRIVFEKYILVAEFISFAASCVSSCMLYSMISKKTDKSNTENLLLLISALPYLFVIFTPTYISLLLMFIISAAYFVSNGSIKLFAAAAVLACLTGKLGIIAFLIYPLQEYGERLIKTVENTVLKSKLAYSITLACLFILDGIILFILIRGMQ